MAKKHKKDSRTKKDHRLRKRLLVKRGLCRQCGKRRDKGSSSTVRCSRCARIHNRYMKAYAHRPATASTKGKTTVAAREARHGRHLRRVSSRTRTARATATETQAQASV